MTSAGRTDDRSLIIAVRQKYPQSPISPYHNTIGDKVRFVHRATAQPDRGSHADVGRIAVRYSSIDNNVIALIGKQQ